MFHPTLQISSKITFNDLLQWIQQVLNVLKLTDRILFIQHELDYLPILQFRVSVKNKDGFLQCGLERRVALSFFKYHFQML